MFTYLALVTIMAVMKALWENEGFEECLFGLRWSLTMIIFVYFRLIITPHPQFSYWSSSPVCGHSDLSAISLTKNSLKCQYIKYLNSVFSFVHIIVKAIHHALFHSKWSRKTCPDQPCIMHSFMHFSLKGSAQNFPEFSVPSGKSPLNNPTSCNIELKL